MLLLWGSLSHHSVEGVERAAFSALVEARWVPDILFLCWSLSRGFPSGTQQKRGAAAGEVTRPKESKHTSRVIHTSSLSDIHAHCVSSVLFPWYLAIAHLPQSSPSKAVFGQSILRRGCGRQCFCDSSHSLMTRDRTYTYPRMLCAIFSTLKNVNINMSMYILNQLNIPLLNKSYIL